MMPRKYDIEKIEMESETNNVLLHVAIMVSISVFFMVYFQQVESNPTLQEQTIQNSPAIPIGQLLAFEGYLGYVTLKLVRIWQQNIKLKRTWSSVLKIGLKMFYEYVTWVINLIAIYVISMEFFVYCCPNLSSDKALEFVKISDLMFVTVLPGLAIISHLGIRKIRLESKDK